MTPIPIEHKHSGKGATFGIDGKRYYVTTCCELSEVEITDQDDRQCVTTCPNHSQTRRTYEPALTDDRRSQLDWQMYGSFDDRNPISDPDGEHQQRQRKSGATTFKWYASRGL